MYSKSLFTAQTNLPRSIINPVGVSSSQLTFSSETMTSLRAVQEYYTWHLSKKTYDKIPTEYTKFLHLFHTVRKTHDKIGNKNLRLLLQITEDGLVGAMNVYGLNYSNIELTLQNTMLQNTIDDILSGKNVKTAFGTNTGQLSIKKTFTLAPLFSYYILLYGMPEQNVGFDQNKLSILLSILEKNCIDPYK